MAVDATHVRALANAYRETLVAGDREFASEPVERKILTAMVATSAANTLAWIHSRQPDGDLVGEPLQNLLPALQKGNVVGQSLDRVQKVLTDQASSAVTSLVFAGTVPVWVSSVVAAIAGLVGFASEAGASMGRALIVLVLGGGGAAYGVMRTFAASGDVLKGAGEGAGSLWRSAGAIGARSEHLLRQHVGDKRGTITGAASAETGAESVALKLRGGAQTLVGAAFAVLALAAAMFLFGLISAFQAYSECPVTTTDGTCVTDLIEP